MSSLARNTLNVLKDSLEAIAKTSKEIKVTNDDHSDSVTIENGEISLTITFNAKSENQEAYLSLSKNSEVVEDSSMAVRPGQIKSLMVNVVTILEDDFDITRAMSTDVINKTAENAVRERDITDRLSPAMHYLSTMSDGPA